MTGKLFRSSCKLQLIRLHSQSHLESKLQSDKYYLIIWQKQIFIPQTTLPQYCHKLVLLGDTAVGKSSIVYRFVRDRFSQDTEPTLGAGFIAQQITLSDCIVKYEIWDTAGQERFATLAPLYYRGAPAAVIVYNVNDAKTYARAKFWVDEVKNNGLPGCIIALAGNMIDKLDGREVSHQEASGYADENKLIFFETSAKTGEGIKDMFTKLAQMLPKVGPKVNGLTDNFDDDSKKKTKPGCC